MKGEDFAQFIERELKRRGIPKGKFYEEIGVSASAMFGWKRGAEPKKETVKAVEEYFGMKVPKEFGINLDKLFVSTIHDEESKESEELRELLKNRYDLRSLLRSAKDVPPSSVYALISQIEKEKEGMNQN